MDRDQAVQIKEKALTAVESLMSVLAAMKDQVPPDEFERIKRSVGLAVGAIEMHINVPLYQMFPDLET
jgi:hypothetical protein